MTSIYRKVVDYLILKGDLEFAILCITLIKGELELEQQNHFAMQTKLGDEVEHWKNEYEQETSRHNNTKDGLEQSTHIHVHNVTKEELDKEINKHLATKTLLEQEMAAHAETIQHLADLEDEISKKAIAQQETFTEKEHSIQEVKSDEKNHEEQIEEVCQNINIQHEKFAEKESSEKEIEHEDYLIKENDVLKEEDYIGEEKK